MAAAVAFRLGLLFLSVKPRVRIGPNLNGITERVKLLLLLKLKEIVAHRILNLNILKALKVEYFAGDLENLTHAKVLDLLDRAEGIREQINARLKHGKSLQTFG